MYKAVFLDRDGTINVETHFCKSVEDFELLPTVVEAIRLLNLVGYKVLVITNQSGIARGYFTDEALSAIHHKMKVLLISGGAHVDGIYCCPHIPDENCDCHKPKAGLALRAIKEHDIDVKNSFVIGDSGSDMAVGKMLGCITIQVGDKPDRQGQEGDFRTRDMLEAVKLIIERNDG